MATALHQWIDGKKIEGTGAKVGDIYNPATGEVQATVRFASAKDTRRAIEAALKAFPAWAATTPIARARILFKFKTLIESHIAELVGKRVGPRRLPRACKAQSNGVYDVCAQRQPHQAHARRKFDRRETWHLTQHGWRPYADRAYRARARSLHCEARAPSHAGRGRAWRSRP